MSEGAGEGFSAAFEVREGNWQALQWNLSRYEDKLEQSDAADQECFSVSDVILLMLDLYTLLQISLYLQ